MTGPALAWEQTGTIPQRTTRMSQGGLLGRPTAVFAGGVLPTTGGGSHGVVGTNDLTPSGTTLTIAFTVGGCFINGTSSIAQGTYYWYNDVAGATVTLAAYNAQPRIDLVGVWVKDNAEDGSLSTLCGLDKVTGTASGSPAVPTAPAGFLVLGQVAVPATSGATVVTPKKTYAAGIGGVIRCTSTTRPTGAALWQGQEIYELDTRRKWAYSGTAWEPVKGRFGCAMVFGGSLATGFTTIVWNVEAEDTDNFSAIGGTNITIPAGLGGKYVVSAYANSAVAASALGDFAFYVNGSIAGQSHIPAAGGDAMVARSITLAAGDVITVQLGNGHSVAVTFTVTCEVFRIGD